MNVETTLLRSWDRVVGKAKGSTDVIREIRSSPQALVSNRD